MVEEEEDSGQGHCLDHEEEEEALETIRRFSETPPGVEVVVWLTLFLVAAPPEAPPYLGILPVALRHLVLCC